MNEHSANIRRTLLTFGGIVPNPMETRVTHGVYTWDIRRQSFINTPWALTNYDAKISAVRIDREKFCKLGTTTSFL